MHEKNDLGLKIYPNPSFGIFNLAIEKGSSDIDISVFDLQGQKVFADKVLSFDGSITREINLGGLSKGIYYLRLTSDNVTQVEKLVIN